uniref:Uncharacterized protein n=1 Tax=viral metagenome TaxID=1070528 RepID=A0A6C0J7V2_9ZZZZ
MSKLYTEIHTVIEEYFKSQINMGISLRDIMNSFKQPTLPYELTENGYPTSELLRHAQLVLTRYIIKHNNDNSRKITFD